MSLEWIREKLDTRAEKARKAADREQLLADFKAADKRALLKMSDIDLATWQSGFPNGSPQFIFAEHQWKVRLARKTAAFAALIALFSGLLGAAFNQAFHRPVADKSAQQTPQNAGAVAPEVKPAEKPSSTAAKVAPG